MLGIWKDKPPDIGTKVALMEAFHCDWPTLHRQIDTRDWSKMISYLGTIEKLRKEHEASEERAPAEGSDRRLLERVARFSAGGTMDHVNATLDISRLGQQSLGIAVEAHVL